MIKTLSFLFLIAISLSSSAQLALSLDNAQQQDINIPTLDSLYKSGVHSNPDSAVFNDQQNDYIKAYYGMLQEMNSYLNDNSFRWGGITRGFNRIYFNEDGTIQFFIYDFEDEELSPERLERFNQLLNEFIADFKFPLNKNLKFSQCSPANYRDVL